MARISVPGGIDRFYRELRRRKVIRVAAFYIVASWVVIEAASVIFPAFLLPDWSERLLILIAAFAFPFVIVLAWIFDITPAGVKRTDAETLAAALPPPRPAPVAAPPERSLAVLPFRNIGGDKENEYFCEGLAEDLLIMLSRVQGLRVAARSSAFAFRDETNDVRVIGERLNVANVLEGSVRKLGNQLRIAVRLVDTANGYQRWTEVFDRELGDIFDVQDEISRAVFESLDVEVYGAARPQATRGTHDTEAYNLYLMGRHQFHKRTDESLRSAVRFFEQATERDPKFALPYTGLSDAYALLSNSGEGYGSLPIEEAIARATPMAARALELDPRLAEAYASRGFLGRLRRDTADAEQSLKRAIELDAHYSMAHVWLALTYTDQGRLREARNAFQRAYDADPLSPIIGSNLGFALAKVGEHDAAREHFERVLEISPEFTVAHSGMAYVARRLDRPDEAKEWWERASRINPQRAYYPASLAMLQLEYDDFAAAEKSAQRAESITPNDPLVVRTRMSVLIATDRVSELCSFTEGRLEGERSTAETLANAALAQLIAGQPDRALQLYDRVGEDLEQWTLDSLVWSWRFPHGIHCANALALTGAQERAAALLDDADALYDRLQGEGLINPDLDYQRAAVLTLRGEPGKAASALERARQRGWRAQWWARRDPALATMREQGQLQTPESGPRRA